MNATERITELATQAAQGWNGSMREFCKTLDANRAEVSRMIDDGEVSAESAQQTWSAAYRGGFRYGNWTVNETDYGTYHHGRSERGEGGSYHRVDMWVPAGGQMVAARGEFDGELGYDRAALYGADDNTPIHSGKYSADCACCYLNHTHSEKYHANAVRVAKERRERRQSQSN